MNNITSYVKGLIEDNTYNPSNCFILTGGPGVGKTSIISRLRELGYGVVDEAATTIIQEQLAEGVNSPWLSKDFEDKVVALQEKRRIEEVAQNITFIFFDRGPVDPLVYQLREDSKPTKAVVRAVQKVIDEQLYNKIVFFVDNLGFCEQTETRAETNLESMAIGNDLERGYKALGFKVIHIPNFPHLEKEQAIQARAELILQQIAEKLSLTTSENKLRA